MMSDAPTNTGKPVTSNVACVLYRYDDCMHFLIKLCFIVCCVWLYVHHLIFFIQDISSNFLQYIKPELEVTSIKQPTCLKQPNKMFPNVNYVSPMKWGDILFLATLSVCPSVRPSVCPSVRPLATSCPLNILKSLWVTVILLSRNIGHGH